ncbi:TPA: hypothetical protein DIC21_01115 [Candidatus Uhrbacteria bacterium]|nr:hypothetical protein [Candidatus Uhrbacteria bacterium]
MLGGLFLGDRGGGEREGFFSLKIMTNHPCPLSPIPSKPPAWEGWLREYSTVCGGGGQVRAAGCKGRPAAPPSLQLYKIHPNQNPIKAVRRPKSNTSDPL